MADHEPMTDVACGDPELSADLRDALTLLRDRSDSDEFRALVDDVLTGRCSLLDASGAVAFGSAVFAPIAQEFQQFTTQQFTTQCDHMTEEDKQRLAAEGEVAGEGASCGPCTGCPGICAALRPDSAH